MTSAERLKQYEELFAKSQAYNPAQFQQGFEKDYGEATNYNKDLIDQRANVVGQMQSLPAELRAKYAQSAIRNPLEQEALIAQRRGTQTSDLNRLTDFLAARGSRYEDVLGKNLQAYLADQQVAQTAAENAWRMYQDQLAQEEAARARAAAAAQAAQMADLMRSQYIQPQIPQEEEIIIDTGEDDNWTRGFEKSQTTPLAKTSLGRTLGINTPDWVTATPFGTFSNMIGNLIGNRNRPNTSFLDKLFDRR